MKKQFTGQRTAAVSRIANPPALELRAVCRLAVGDTAGWQPALQALAERTQVCIIRACCPSATDQ